MVIYLQYIAIITLTIGLGLLVFAFGRVAFKKDNCLDYKVK